MSDRFEAIAICRHCLWGVTREEADSLDELLEMVKAHCGYHDVDIRVFNTDEPSLKRVGRDNQRLTDFDLADQNRKLNYLDETGEFK